MLFPFHSPFKLFITSACLSLVLFSSCNKQSNDDTETTDNSSDLLLPIYTKVHDVSIIPARPVIINTDTLRAPSYIKIAEKQPYSSKDASGKSIKVLPPQYIPDSSSPHILVNTQYVIAGKPRYILLKNPSYKKIPKITSLTIAGQPGIAKAGIPIMRENAIYNIKYFNQDMGLPSLLAQCLLQDNQNRLWIGTDNGLSVYDGETFRTYTGEQGLNQNYILSLCQDRKGNIWTGTYGGGVNVFDGKTFKYFNESNGLPNNYVHCITEDHKGNIWMGTEGGGVVMFDGKGFNYYSIKQGLGDSLVRTIAEDQKGNILIGTKEHGLYIFDGKGFTVYTKEQGLTEDKIKCLEVAKNGNIWIGTNGGGAMAFDGRGFEIYTTKQGLKDDKVAVIHEDRHGNIWMGTGKGGVNKLEGNTIRYFSSVQGLSNNTVRSIAEDRSGNIWIGTLGGLNVCDNLDFKHFNNEQGLSYNLVEDITEDKVGNIWLGTDGGGINKYDGKGFLHFKTDQGLAGNNIRSLYTAKNGNIWVGLDGAGLNVYDGKGFYNYNAAQGLSNQFIYSIIEDRKGKIWLGTMGGGINVIDKGSILKYTTSQGLGNNDVQGLLEDSRDNIWVATNSGGVSVFDGANFRHYTTLQGLSHNTVMSLAEDAQGNIWIGTLGGGVNIFDGKGFFKYTIDQGLPDNAVIQLARDKKGLMWAGTGKGLVCFKPEGKNKWKLYTYRKSHGLKFEDFNGPCNPIIFSQWGWSKGKMWSGVDAEFCEFTPNYFQDTLRPKVFITGVNLEERLVNWATPFQLFLASTIQDTLKLPNKPKAFFTSTLPGDTTLLVKQRIRYEGVEDLAPYHLPKQLSIPHSRNHLTFSFSGLRFGDWTDIRYQYMMQGFDKKWSPVTSESKADYRGLPPGQYNFRVKAQGKNGLWSEEASFSFEVRPPWWSTWYARTLYVLLFLLGIRTFVRWRTRALKERQEELADQVEKKTAEVVKQKDLLEVKQREILDSIHYASRIQRALLTSDNYIKQNLEAEYFILYKPKDIVSGDFYWAMAIDQSKHLETRNPNYGNKLFYLCTADCTGHGVPGAFMSMLNISYLTDNLIERNLVEPAIILNRQREEIIHALNPDGSTVESQDGMDCVLYALDLEKMKIYYAAANNPLWIFRNGELIKNKPDKMPVGKYGEILKPFSQSTVDLQKGDIIYTFTDGYADQFGGPRGKKFMYKQLEELLKSIGPLDMFEQKRVLDKTFERWKDGLEQVDDVLIIGIRV